MYFLYTLYAFCIRGFGIQLVKVAFYAYIISAALSHSTLHFLKLPLMQTVQLTSFIYGFF